MGGIGSDIRYGFRTLRASPGLSIAIVAVLSLGIGMIASLFTMVDALILRPLDYRDPARLVYVWEKSPHSDRSEVSLPAWRDWSGSPAFESLAAVRPGNLFLTGMGEPERLSVGLVSANLFTVLGAQPALGRSFAREEDTAGAAPTLVLTHGLWQRRFGADPNILGRPVTLDDRRFTVVGVLGAGFRFTPSFDAYVPLTCKPQEESRTARTLMVIGRLAEGVTIEQANGEMERIARLAGPTASPGVQPGAFVDPMQGYLYRGPRADLPVLITAAALVLLIACCNVASLLVARGANRAGEIALRSALGASRWRLMRQLLSESLLLALAAGAVGTILAHWAAAGIQRMIPAGLLGNNPEFTVNVRVLLSVLGVAVTTAVIFGLLPAWMSSGTDLRTGMKGPGGGARAPRALRGAGRVLVNVEIALAVVLLTGSGLMIRAFSNLTRIAPVPDPEKVTVAQLSLPETRYPKQEQRSLFLRQLLAQAETLPGSRSAAVTTVLPFRGNTPAARFEAQPGGTAQRHGLSAHLIGVSEKYFEVTGIAIKQGRAFLAGDTPGSVRVAIVNETAARRLLGDRGFAGQRLSMTLGVSSEADPHPVTLEVVGVCADLGGGPRPEANPPQVFVPYFQNPGLDVSILLRTEAASAAVAVGLREVVQAIDKDQPINEITTVHRLRDRSFSVGRVLTTLMATFGALALVLSTMGVYSLVSYSVTRRRQEIAIRMALGARGPDIVRMVLTQGIGATAVGLGLGLSGAIGVALLMRGLLFGVTVKDPILFVGIPLLLAAVALGATYLPARRAAAREPMSLLRLE